MNNEIYSLTKHLIDVVIAELEETEVSLDIIKRIEESFKGIIAIKPLNLQAQIKLEEFLKEFNQINF